MMIRTTVLKSIKLSIVSLFCLFAAVDPVLAYTEADKKSLVKKIKKENQQRMNQTVLEGTYRALEKINKHIDNKEYQEAEKRIKKLIQSRKGNRFELSNIYITYSNLLVELHRYNEAKEHLEKVIIMDVFDFSRLQQIRYVVAQIYAMNENWQQTIKALEEWFFIEQARMDAVQKKDKIKAPDSQAYLLLGNAYAQNQQQSQAIPLVRKAIDIATKPNEKWYALLISLYYQEKNITATIAVLREVITLYPQRKRYWLDLASMYMLQHEDKKALQALELAHTQGLLDKGRELSNLANFLSFHNIPFKAAELLSYTLENQLIDQNEKNYVRLSNFWMEARELDKATETLKKAAVYSTSAELDIRLGQLFIEQEKWAKAIEALNKGFNKGKLKQAGKPLLLLGQAQYELGRTTQALKTFKNARTYMESRKYADQWVKLIEVELAVNTM